MCDYSLHHVANRPAKIEDKLVTTKFNNSITRGFAAIGEPTVAVCLLPGTEIAFETDIIEYRHALLPNRKLAEKVARFRQINMDNPKTHHNALEGRSYGPRSRGRASFDERFSGAQRSMIQNRIRENVYGN